MTRLLCVAMAAMCMVPSTALAQEGSVSRAVKEIFDRYSKNMVDASKVMPADKYSFRPTSEQWTFGEIVAHVVFANFNVCSIVSDNPRPEEARISDTAPKDTMVESLQASADFCEKVLPKLQDSRLEDTVIFFGGRQTPRARAAIELAIDVVDHYAQMAMYLRLNGLEPPLPRPIIPRGAAGR